MLLMLSPCYIARPDPLYVGHNNGSALGTLVERTTRMTFLVQLKDKDATAVRESFAKEFKHLPKDLKRSLTYDQGQEMAEHKLFTKSTQIKVYFAHPHSLGNEALMKTQTL